MRLKFLFPILVFAGLLAFFFIGLGHDPSLVPSPLIDRPAPEFDLPPLEAGAEGLKTADFMGRVTLVNFFASWCLPCKAEHPLLIQLQKEGRVRVVGINYKDKPEEARRWLAEEGNPYDRIGVDPSGRVAIDWGVYGLPESYLVDQKGRIRWKHVGVLMPDDWQEDFLPRIERLDP
ncbi:MAG: DsbE family thiol:disulfide interchange protein [Alphaproteobacteria bacterium]|nr:DsbE family thiol:disulfide interchange protein [Alphaproteobacteria bacterium]